ncbi:elongation factor P [bacterium]|nr:elongation factor P [bacterium]
MATTTNDFRNGMVIRKDRKLYTIVSFLHVKPGKGAAFVRSKLKEIRSGRVLEITWRAGEKIEDVRLDRVKAQFLYRDDMLNFMRLDNYDQLSLQEVVVGERNASFLKDGMEVEFLLDGDQPITIEMPTFVELEITKTDPGVKGDTVSGGSKPATLESGAVVQVPLFLSEGTVVKVDTRTGEYVSRV